MSEHHVPFHSLLPAVAVLIRDWSTYPRDSSFSRLVYGNGTLSVSGPDLGAGKCGEPTVLPFARGSDSNVSMYRSQNLVHRRDTEGFFGL